MIRFAKALLAALSLGCLLIAQTPPPPAVSNNAPDNKAGAYYNFAMGRLYAELAAAEGNKGDLVSKAIQHYQDALKADPSASIIFEELTDLYIQTGRLKDAVTQAEDMLKQNPENMDARRMLGRIYVRVAGADTQSGRLDEAALARAIEQYQKITEKEPKDAESWVMLGRLYRVSNKSPEAEKAFNAALTAEPENEDALTQLADLYGDLGDSKKAIEKLQAAASKTPSERTLLALAEQYEQIGASNDQPAAARIQAYKSAADTLRKAMELAPDNDKIPRGLAADLMNAGQLDDAIAIYTQLLGDEPRDSKLWLGLYEAYRTKHDFGKAREALDKAKALEGNTMEMRYQEVKLLEAQAKADEALAALKSMIDDSARKTYSDADARRRAGLLQEYGVVSQRAEKYQQAIDAFRQAANLSNEMAAPATFQIIETYRQSKDYDNALREAEAAVKKYPDEAMFKMERANILSDQGKVDAAVTEIKGLSKNDHDRDTLAALAQVYEKGKRYADEGKLLDEWEKAAGTTDDDKINIHFMRGAMYERMKKFDLSEAEFRKVLDVDKDNAGAMNYLGYMLADRGVRLEEAAELIKKAVDSDPNNGAYLDSLGWVYFRQGKLDEAQGLLQRAIENRMGTDPTVHDHLGDVYFKMGKTKEAITQWQTSIKAFQSASASDSDPDEVAKVNKKLDEARVRLAKETRKQN